MTRRRGNHHRVARSAARGGVRRERHEPAYALLLAVMALTAIGIVMVYSASSVRSYFSSADPAAQGMEQLVWAGSASAACWWRCGSTSAICATWPSRCS